MIVLRWVLVFLWPGVALMATFSVVWIWNSEERTESLERSLQPIYDLWRLRARSVGAASLTLLASALVLPKEVVSLMHGGAAAEGGFSEIADNLARAGLYGFFFFGFLWVTSNVWGRPRWIIPPYLRPVRKRDRATAPPEHGTSPPDADART